MIGVISISKSAVDCVLRPIRGQSGPKDVCSSGTVPKKKSEAVSGCFIDRRRPNSVAFGCKYPTFTTCHSPHFW